MSYLHYGNAIFVLSYRKKKVTEQREISVNYP